MLAGSDVAIFGLLMDFDVDEQRLGSAGQESLSISDVSLMYIQDMHIV
jgi:hypothetical protein